MPFLVLLLATVGFATSANAQTATVTWDEFLPAFVTGGPNGVLSNGDAVPIGTTVSFDVHMFPEFTYGSAPSGCNITHDSGDTWSATITETCHVTIQAVPIIVSAWLPDAEVGAHYTSLITVFGGHSPLNAVLESGDLPDGITYAGSMLSGTPSEEGSFDFTIRATDGYGHFAARSFTLTVNGASASPTITSVSPANGPGEGGTVVTISGTGLTGATAVTFGSDPVFNFTVNNDTQITATTPPHAQGPVDVVVITPGGSATATGGFTYDAPVELFLSIDDVSIVEGNSGGTFVTFNITLDRPVPQFRQVTFDIATVDGTASAGVDYVASSTAGASIGAGSIGGSFSVQILGDTLDEPDETFFVNVTNVVGATVVKGQGVGTIVNDDAPAGHAVSWSVSGGTSTTVTATIGGTPLMSGDTVPLNSVVEFLVLPANGGTYTEAPTGCGVQYVGSSAGGDLWRTGPVTANCTAAFTVRWAEMLPPSQTGLTATLGQPYGVQFTIANSYGPFTDWSWLHTVGTVPDGLSLDGATGLFSGTPTESGTFTFVIDARNGVGHHSVYGYTLTVVEPAPTIAAISPTSGTTAGGMNVIITGTNFGGATQVMFGVTPAAGFTVNSATSITATTPAHAAGAVDVLVTTPSGDATATGAFTYDAPVPPSLSISDASVTEGGVVAFVVTLTPAAGPGGVTFDVATANGTALAGIDYVASNLTGQTIPAGSSSYTFQVTTVDDALHEPTKSFFANVTNVVGATVVDGQGVGTINDDDVAAPTANDVSATVAYGSSQTITPDITGGAATSIAITAFPAHGTAAVNGMSIIYTPAVGYAGPDSFTYTATGPGGTSTPAAVTVTVSTPTIAYTPANPAPGTVGTAYSQSLAGASGGAAPYAYAQSTGTLPSGLTLDSDGTLHGTPDVDGTFDFEIIATDSSSGSGPFSSAPANVTVTIGAAAPTITAVTPANGLTTGGTSVTITGTHLAGATGVTFGGVPATALAVSSATSITVTTPAHAAGPVDVAVTTPGGSVTLSGAFTYEVPASNDASLANLAVSAGALSPGFTPGAIGYTVSVPNPVNSLTLTPTAAHAGATISVNGRTVASGSPSSAIILAVGDNTITVVVTAEDASTTRTYVVTVTRAAPAISIDPQTLPGAVAGSAYGPVTLTAEGGAAPYAFAVTTGNLPDGLSVAATGELDGTPAEAGTFTFTVTATDAEAFTGARDYVLAVDPPTIAIGPDTLPDGLGGAAYGPVNLTADGGAAPYVFALTAGALPNGLTLAASGEISGKPLEVGNFSITVTATDSNSFTASRQFSLSIDMPEIVVTAPAMPEGKVNTPFAAVRLSASGGVGPYAFSVTAGELPRGMVFSADGRLSGTPTQAGDFTVTVAAADSLGFAGTASLSLRINNVNIPVAQDLTLEVMAGTSGSIDLTQGATNGPFTRAAIAVHPAAEVGRAAIRRDGAAYVLDFAAANTFEGSASLQYTLSNADGRSAPATVTLNIIARPDPSQDPEVIGLLTAQAEAAKRFARTQTQNFNQRLEQLHDEGDRRRNSMSANMSLQRRESDRAAYYAKEEERDRIREAFERVDAHAKDSAKPASNASDPSGDHNPLGRFAIWSGGFVNFAEADNGSIDLDSTLVGLSGGADYRFTPKFVAGLGFGYGRDKTDIGQNGTESLGQAWSMAAYGSYKPTPDIFIDGLIGYSFMSFDSRRHISATGDFAMGSRDGQQVFGSLTAGYEHRRGGWLLSPYGRLEASRSRLDAFTESGGGMWDLTYGRQTIDTLSGILGLRVEYAMPMDWGVLKPRARVEYTHDFEGSSRVGVGYADIGTLPYSVETEPFSKDHLTIGLGVDAQIGDGWTLGFDYRTAYGSGGRQQDHTFAIKVGAQF